MTLNESSTAADAITAATVQGLHAFMASAATEPANDTQFEAAATLTALRLPTYRGATDRTTC